MPNRKPFRIAHLSDLHITKKDSDSRSEPKLFGPLKGMNEAFRRIARTPVIQRCDWIVVTGDVTDRGDPEAWKVFWDAMGGAGLHRKAYVIPGNHDVCCLGARIPFLKKVYAKKDLEKAVRGLRMGHQRVKFPWDVSPDPRVVVFGVNSNNLGNWSVVDNALGEIGYYQLVSLASKLHKHRDVPVKIVALHHSPNIPGRGQDPIDKIETKFVEIQKEQRQALRLICLAQRVRLILHGHTHKQRDRRVTGLRIVGTNATNEPVSVSRKPKRRYQFYTYTVYGDGGRVVPKVQTVMV
jgi:3',5'-cyclic AMP phosphodiesterase CpdA